MPRRPSISSRSSPGSGLPQADAVVALDAQPRLQQRAVAVDLLHAALDELHAARRAGLLVHDRRVGRGALGHLGQRCVGLEGLAADQRDRGLRIEGHQLEARARCTASRCGSCSRRPRRRACRRTAAGTAGPRPSRRRRASRRRRTSASADGPARRRPSCAGSRWPMNRSLDGSLSRCTPLVSAPRITDIAATPGALPAITWISRGGKARMRCRRPLGASATSRQPSSTSAPPSSCSHLELHAAAIERPGPAPAIRALQHARAASGLVRTLNSSASASRPSGSRVEPLAGARPARP